jgi:hypothetical protein
MSNNFSFDWSEFSVTSACLDLYGHVSRWAVSDETYTDEVVFRARALTDSFLLTSKQGMALDGGASGDNGAGRYAFRARIEGANSPHSFLADPCDPAYAADLDYVYKLITMHTLFLSTTATSQMPVTRGDVVLVKLKRTNQAYDLQYGTFEKLVSIEDPTGNQGDFCSSLITLFGAIEHKPLPGPSTVSVGSVGSTVAGNGFRASGPCAAKWTPSMAKKYPNFPGGVHPNWAARAGDLATGETLSSPTDAGYYVITSPFGGRSGTHNANDIGAPAGSPIYSMADGVIEKVVTDCPAHSGAPCGPGKADAAPQCKCVGGGGGRMGNYIKIRHAAKNSAGGSIYTYYGHMAAVSAGIAVGSPVKAGQQVGTVGMSGNTNGPHIHLQVHMSGIAGAQAGDTVDPLAYLYANTQNGSKCAGSSPAIATAKCPANEEYWPAGEYVDGTKYPAGCYAKTV